MKWYQIINAAKNPELRIHDVIGSYGGDSVSAKNLIKDVQALGDIGTLDVFINSPGGDVFDGLAIYNYFRAHKATINMFVDGVAASIASVILMAGDTVSMPANTMVMVHNPSGLTIGTSKDMKKTADTLDKIKESLITAYQSKTALDRDELSQMMDAETWLSAEDCKAKGFCDVITDEVKAAAVSSFDFSMYENVPESFFKSGSTGNVNNEANKEVTPMADKNNPGLTLEQLKAQHPDLAKQLQAEGENQALAKLTDEQSEIETKAKADESKRIGEVLALNSFGFDAELKQMALDGKTAAEAALELNKLQAEAGDKELKALKAGSNQPVNSLSEETKPETRKGVFDDLEGEDKYKAEWESMDAKARRDYMNDYETFQAYREADDKGLISYLHSGGK